MDWILRFTLNTMDACSVRTHN